MDRVARADIRSVDTGIGAHEAVTSLCDENALIHFHDAASFTKGDLDDAGVLVSALCETLGEREGVTSRRSMICPSAFETIFWVTTKISPSSGA